jgi:hypothetical protein
MHEQHRMLFCLRKREIKLKMGDLFASGVCTNGAELMKAVGRRAFSISKNGNGTRKRWRVAEADSL